MQDELNGYDPYDLERFVKAQSDCYSRVLTELQTGMKKSHWMWFIFPQIAGLGLSFTSKFYSIKDRSEAEAYLAHPVLGPRLVECCETLLSLLDVSAEDVFGHPDYLKLRSSVTMFALMSPSHPVFTNVLGRYFGGEMDELTVLRMKIAEG